MTTHSVLCCHLCGSPTVDWLSATDRLPQVTSDCKPWRSNGVIGTCAVCGTVQKAVDENWLADVDRIYREYQIYHQGGGAEQVVFAAGNERVMPRSQRLLMRLQEAQRLTQTGRWLDVGCGNGSLLDQCGRMLPGWKLYGSELHDTYRSLVERLTGVEGFYTCPLENIPGRFNVISLVHVLEHIQHPLALLVQLGRQLEPGGRLLIQVPHYEQNPFDLMIADHATHFTPASLVNLLRRAGLAVQMLSTTWIAKEITAIVGIQGDETWSAKATAKEPGAVSLRSAMHWLTQVSQQAGAMANDSPLGLFGTSIAGVWMSQVLGDRIAYFVDEDPTRIGTLLAGRPVIHPRDIPIPSHLYVALAPIQAQQVAQRLARPGLDCQAPPSLNPSAK